MARPVEIRKTYQADVQYIQRLAKAIEMDPRLKPEARKEVLTALQVVKRSLYEILSKE